MIKIIYQSAEGRLLMGGKSADRWRIESITGLGQSNVSSSVVRFPGYHGQKTLEKQLEPRTIVISGSYRVRTSYERQQEVSRAMRICNNLLKGELLLYLHGKERKISCMPSLFEVGHPSKAGQNFVLMLVCDDPFFEDFDTTYVSLYERCGNIKNPLVFPRILTERIVGGNIVNIGDTSTEPIIRISSKADSPTLPATEISTYELSDSEETKTLTLRNATTGSTLTLNHSLEKDEIITIDIAKRVITSNIHGDISYKKTKDSLLSSFVIQRGDNKFEIEKSGFDTYILIEIEYTNRYIEALY